MRPARYLTLENTSARGLRVLLVEDNLVNQRIMGLMLERLPAMLTCAGNGEEGVDAFQLETFDVVLMDLKMPLMDGYEAMRRMRDLEALSGRAPTPIIVVSAHTRPAEIAQAKAAGADHHLGKPLDIPTLLRTMDAVIRGESCAATSACG